jgi:hypothetical protein
MRLRAPLAPLLAAALLMLPTCVDLAPPDGASQAQAQAVLCPSSCGSHSHAGERRVPFLQLARQQLSAARSTAAALSKPVMPLPDKLIAYLLPLRGIRGGATAMAMSPSDFSHLGLSDLVGQTSTAAPSQAASPRAAPFPSAPGDLHDMKLKDLRRELKSRGLIPSGLKSELIDRLERNIADNPNPHAAAGGAGASGKRLKRDHQPLGSASEELGGAKKQKGRPLTESLQRSRKGKSAGGVLELLQEVETVQHADVLFEVFPTQVCVAILQMQN